MEQAIANRRGRPDTLGRITLDWPQLVVAGQVRWLCLDEGEPEPEVLIVIDELGRLVGVPTGNTRPCALPRAVQA